MTASDHLKQRLSTGSPEENEIYAVKCWLYPRLNRFAEDGNRFSNLLANAYMKYEEIYAQKWGKRPVKFVDESQVATDFEEICTWIAEYARQARTK